MNYLKIENGTPTQVSLRELSNELRKAGKSPVAWWQIVDETRRNEILARYDVFPFTEEVRPTYNPDIQKLVRTPFVQDAQGNWSRGWDVVQLTQEEIDAKATQQKQATSARLDDPVQKVLLKIALIHENRIRVLEGKSEITPQQFRQWVEGQI